MTIRQNFDINQGETFTYTFIQKDAAGSAVNLTGYSARMAVRSDLYASPNAYLTTGSDSIGGTITLGGALGTVKIDLTAVQSDALNYANYFLYDFMRDDPDCGIYGPNVPFIYDLELVNGVIVTRALQGFITLHRSVT